jgi:anti-sigma B factor antagonist
VELGIETSTRGATVVVAVTGDVDIHTAPQVAERLDALRAEGCTAIVVDLSDVTFLDSSALGVLIAAHRELAGVGGGLRLAAPRPQVSQVFRITRLAEVIPLFDDVDAACA